MSTILLVEDDTFFQALYTNKLTQSGYTVIKAENGERAISQLTSTIPNLIILDLIMPLKNGFEVLEFLRNDEKLKRIPVIIFSSLNQKEDIDKALALGANDYVDKSDTPYEILNEKIKKLLRA